MLSIRAEVKLNEGSSPRLMLTQVDNGKVTAIIEKPRDQNEEPTRGRVRTRSVKNVVRRIQRGHIKRRQLFCPVCLTDGNKHPWPNNRE